MHTMQAACAHGYELYSGQTNEGYVSRGSVFCAIAIVALTLSNSITEFALSNQLLLKGSYVTTIIRISSPFLLFAVFVTAFDKVFWKMPLLHSVLYKIHAVPPVIGGYYRGILWPGTDADYGTTDWPPTIQVMIVQSWLRIQIAMKVVNADLERMGWAESFESFSEMASIHRFPGDPLCIAIRNTFNYPKGKGSSQFFLRFNEQSNRWNSCRGYISDMDRASGEYFTNSASNGLFVLGQVSSRQEIDGLFLNAPENKEWE